MPVFLRRLLLGNVPCWVGPALYLNLFGCWPSDSSNLSRAPDAVEAYRVGPQSEMPQATRVSGRTPWKADRLVGAHAPPIDVEFWFQGIASYDDDYPVLTVFCEIWAPICKENLPKLGAKQIEYERAGIHVVGLTRVTKSATNESVVTFIQDQQITFPFGKVRFPLDDSTDLSVWKKLHTDRIGVLSLVREGKIVWAGLLDHLPEASDLSAK